MFVASNVRQRQSLICLFMTFVDIMFDNIEANPLAIIFEISLNLKFDNEIGQNWLEV